ncbi:D-glycero-beta-D-manno-heptose 1,7-bisphosphate 7-phosphatase [Candidatus Bipolaricaulota bacterium]|nr:D-glycero-beta-D-manno-heptose 1,7-bisphosphate 7-phosphatase [Candidatus Bipolaricaulota bacterium]
MSEPAASEFNREHKADSSIPFVSEGGGVLLDRDGVISQQTAFVNEPDDLKLIEGAAEAIARLNRAGWPVAIITNQGGIAMGYLTEDALHRIHEKLEQLLAVADAHIDAIYYCPHMENAQLVAFRTDCCCRKPGTGMLEKARDQLAIDLTKSVVVGDSTTDILAGIRAGCSTILVETGFGGKDGKAAAEPDAVAADLSEAVDLILSRLESGDSS